MQNVVNKIPHLSQISIRKPRQKVIAKHSRPASPGKKYSRMLLQRPNQYRSQRSHHLSPHVIPINRLRIRLHIPNRPALILQIHHPRHNIPKLRHFRPYRHGRKRTHARNFILHHPSRQIEIVHGTRIKQHPVQIRVISPNRRPKLIPPNRFKNYRHANLPALNAFHSRSISRVISPHKSNLQTPPRFRDSRKRGPRVAQIQSQRLLAQNIFPSPSGSDHIRGMKFIRRSNQDRVQILPLEHRLQTRIRIFNLEFLGNLPRPLHRKIRDPHQTRLRHQSPQILRVPPPHLPNANHANAKLTHSFPSKNQTRFRVPRAPNLRTGFLTLPLPFPRSEISNLKFEISATLAVSGLRVPQPRRTPNLRTGLLTSSFPRPTNPRQPRDPNPSPPRANISNSQQSIAPAESA